jgi:tRNA 2-thiouridine synthesizing protein A
MTENLSGVVLALVARRADLNSQPRSYPVGNAVRVCWRMAGLDGKALGDKMKSRHKQINTDIGGDAMSEDITLVDASGLKCPLPVLKARKAIKGLVGGAQIRVISTDPASPLDFKHFCNTSGHELLDIAEEGERIEFLIRKAAR